MLDKLIDIIIFLWELVINYHNWPQRLMSIVIYWNKHTWFDPVVCLLLFFYLVWIIICEIVMFILWIIFTIRSYIKYK